MANTYTQIYIHLVFAVKYRHPLIAPSWRERLHKYITGIIQNQENKLIAINTVPNHAHILIGMKPDITLSNLVRDIKRDSTNFVNNEIQIHGKFGWQEGFGAFSCSHSQIDFIIKYIQNQEEHHQIKTFREEYEAMLKDYSIAYDDRYIFEWIDT
jgi:putative transposase